MLEAHLNKIFSVTKYWYFFTGFKNILPGFSLSAILTNQNPIKGACKTFFYQLNILYVKHLFHNIFQPSPKYCPGQF